MEENSGNSFIGSFVLGKGFTFDDKEKNREAVSSLAERERLIVMNPQNAERISPYLGGEEVNSDPEQKHHRYIINFGEMSEAEARNWPDLMAILEAKVKPERLKQNRENRSRNWWRFGETAPSLYRAICNKRRVLANSMVTPHLCFAWQPTDRTFSHTLIVYADDRDPFFAVLQSSVHETWARYFASTAMDLLRYTPSDCFETFPFPAGWETSAALEDIGKRYDAHRAGIMRATIGTKRPEGLTATYNRFHDPDERSPAIATLRALHAEMDRAVLDAYGWTDLRPAYDFRVQLDERVRLTWDDDTRDEVLARLLEENRRRAEAMKARAAVEAAPAKKGKAKAKGGRDEGSGTPGLPGVG